MSDPTPAAAPAATSAAGAVKAAGGSMIIRIIGFLLLIFSGVMYQFGDQMDYNLGVISRRSSVLFGLAFTGMIFILLGGKKK